eukprot:GHVQ01002702.1.p1 GENE.GHVQ01002702.1~~GHVQ01002702.1.p1  ORF type:complete len:495 (+),score=120.61 GHVQ01002702.1:253-1737(+)
MTFACHSSLRAVGRYHNNHHHVRSMSRWFCRQQFQQQNINHPIFTNILPPSIFVKTNSSSTVSNEIIEGVSQLVSSPCRHCDDKCMKLTAACHAVASTMSVFTASCHQLLFVTPFCLTQFCRRLGTIKLCESSCITQQAQQSRCTHSSSGRRRKNVVVANKYHLQSLSVLPAEYSTNNNNNNNSNNNDSTNNNNNNNNSNSNNNSNNNNSTNNNSNHRKPAEIFTSASDDKSYATEHSNNSTPVCSSSPLPSYPEVRLKENDTKTQRRLLAGHPWVFNSEIENYTDISHLPAGSLVVVTGTNHECVGMGMLNRRASLTVRMLTRRRQCHTNGGGGGRMDNLDLLKDKKRVNNYNSWLLSETEIKRLVASRIRQGIMQRQGAVSWTSFCRVVSGEADLIPGLVVDKFGPALVVRFDSLGMQRLEGLILEELGQILQPKQISVSKMNLKTEKLHMVRILKSSSPVSTKFNSLKKLFYFKLSLNCAVQLRGKLCRTS